jgi:hypothetical protein
MTSYWKPRWENNVVFGSFKKLNYRIDISEKEGGIFRIRTKTGPGENFELIKSTETGGFVMKGKISDVLKSCWLDDKEQKKALTGLLESHFSKIVIGKNHIDCFCKAKNDDILPEGKQLSWCVSCLHFLLSKVPDSQKRDMKKSEFME